jgi:hypothetical protein
MRSLLNVEFSAFHEGNRHEKKRPLAGSGVSSLVWLREAWKRRQTFTLLMSHRDFGL